MMETRYYPEGEPRDVTADRLIAEARGFSSVTELREYRAATPERQAEMRSAHEARKREEPDDDLPTDEDMRLYADYLRICVR